MKIKLDKTDSKVIHSNETYDVIDNTNLFKRAGLPWPIRLAMSQAKIDPYYTRFDSELRYELDEVTEDGYGVLEVMDLK